MLPVATYADSTWRHVDDDQAETIGWPAYAAQVRGVLDALPEAQRRNAVVFTSNYAEAGALGWYHVDVGVYSRHNGYGDWGPPPADAGPWIVVGHDPVTEDFRGCDLADRVGDPWQLDNGEAGAGIWGLRRSGGERSRSLGPAAEAVCLTGGLGREELVVGRRAGVAQEGRGALPLQAAKRLAVAGR
jgi:hypothetical protein